jgi:predicted nucleotidyltransferase
MKQNKINIRLFEALERESLHQRELSRKMGVNQTQIKRNLDGLEEKNILSSKKIGKSKTYSIKDSIESKVCKRILENEKLFEILKNKTIRFVYKKIYDILQEKKIPKDRIIVLFGSYAKGNHDSNSDIDIYINSELKNEKKLIESISEKINVKIGKFNKAGLLEKEIIKNHIILNNVEGFLNLE